MCADITHKSPKVAAAKVEVVQLLIQSLDEKIRALDEKTKLMVDEAEKRNGQRFDAQQEAVSTAMIAAEKAVGAAMAAAEKAVTKAELAAEERFKSVNEFRQTLTDQQATFLTRTEYMVQHKSIGEKIDGVTGRVGGLDSIVGDIRARGAGRGDLWGNIASVIAILVSVGTLSVLLFRH